MIPTDLKTAMRIATREFSVEPAYWSHIGPEHCAGYLNNIPLVAVHHVAPVEPNREQRELVGWHTYTRARKPKSLRWPPNGPFETKEQAEAVATQLIRLILEAATADPQIEWVHEWREGEIFGDWRGYAHDLEISHIVHCEGGGRDYQKKRMWRGWFGAGIFGGSNDDPCEYLNELVSDAKELVGAMWVRWLEIANEVFAWPNPFFEVPATRVFGELHREKYWRGQMLMGGDGI